MIINNTEDQYYQNIQNVLNSSNDLEELNDSLNNIIENVIKDNREIYKTPIIAYAETIKKSAYYWAPVTIGGSGKGDLILMNGDNYDNRSWAKAADTDGKALASGFIGLAAYGAWGVLFGPAGFALIAADVVFVVVGAAISSAMFP